MHPFSPVSLSESFRPYLATDDDENFWALALSVLFRDVESELAENARPLKLGIYAQVGACSHWLRPHQTRLNGAGGFAWPSGYAGSASSRFGLPEFDWSLLFSRDTQAQCWQPVAQLPAKKYSLFRAALPTRTRRHQQAAVSAIWLPHHPIQGTTKPMQAYGFRKIEGRWQCLMPVALDSVLI